MAYRDYRIVCFTPSGRKRTQSILLDNLSRFTDIIDEYQIWLNTDPDQIDDLKWLKSLPKIYPWVKVVDLPAGFERQSPKQLNTGFFYVDTTDKKTIYIRFDDDIVFVDDLFFNNLLDFRIDNPDYFLVMANIWNNAVLSYVHQQLGNIPSEEFVVEEPYCMDPVAWRSGPFAELIHGVLLEHINRGTTSKLFFGRADLNDYTRFSISCFCFFGKDFAKFEGVVGQRQIGRVRFDEEVWLTEVFPSLNKVKNVVCGNALVSHYSFFAQRPYLDTLPILQSYKDIARGKLSEAYYDLLGEKSIPRAKSSDLETIKLPKASGNYSSYSEILAAEKAGYSVTNEDYGFAILKNGAIVKTIRGDTNEWLADRELVNAYRSNM